MLLCNNLSFLCAQAMNEILYGIRVIKFYAWEKLFSAKVRKLRYVVFRYTVHETNCIIRSITGS